MSGLVEEIQKDALNGSVSVTNLLRKVKLAAAKLRLGKVENWVQAELDGYREDLPAYRILYGRPQAFNPYNGWIPIITGDPEFDETLSRCEVREPISSLEKTVAQSDGSILRMPYSAAMITELNRAMDMPFGKMGVALTVSQVQHVVETVRNSTLDWAIDLERSGITGEGVSFSSREREKAQDSSVTYNIGSIGEFAGNLGQGNSSGNIALNKGQLTELRQFADEVARNQNELVKAGVSTEKLSKAIDGLRAEAEKAQLTRRHFAQNWSICAL